MSSTDRDPIDALAGAIWDESIVPHAGTMRARGARFFEPGPDPGAKTYFEAPTHRVMEEADFRFPGDGDPAALIDALAAHWTAEGHSELAAMAPRLKELAALLQERPESENPDVSPFVYTMY